MDKSNQEQLNTQFLEASKLLEDTSIVSAEKRQCADFLKTARDNLTDDASQQEINNTLLLLPVIVTALKHGIEQENMAGSDPLTGVANRRTYEDTGNRTISKLTRGDTGSAAVLYIDIKNFRDFNNNYGHDVGDKALIAITKKIKEATRNTDFLSRVGGDEFTILASHKDKDHDFSIIRDNIYRKFEGAHIEHEGQEIPLVVTIGVAEFTKNDTLEAAAKRADEDMYTQKQIQKREMGENIYAPEVS